MATVVFAQALAHFSDDAISSSRGYVEMGISDTERTCEREIPCPGAAVNFASFSSGAVELEEVGEHVKGTFDLEMEDGAPISGRFDARACN
ncbi:MAG: hypothetical protein ACODAU_12740 [Myxococcota bacterium]